MTMDGFFMDRGRTPMDDETRKRAKWGCLIPLSMMVAVVLGCWAMSSYEKRKAQQRPTTRQVETRHA